MGLGPVSGFTIARIAEHFASRSASVPVSFAPIRPQRRLTFIDTRNGESLELGLNPERFRYRVEPNFDEAEIIGLPFEPVTYSHTRNRKIGPLPILLHGLMQSSPTPDKTGPDLVEDALSFFESISVRSSPFTTAETPDPIVIFNWPGMAVMDVVLRMLDVDIVEMISDGFVTRPLVVRVSLEMTEVLRGRIFSTDLRQAFPWLNHRGLGGKSFAVGQTGPHPLTGGRAPQG